MRRQTEQSSQQLRNLESIQEESSTCFQRVSRASGSVSLSSGQESGRMGIQGEQSFI